MNNQPLFFRMVFFGIGLLLFAGVAPSALAAGTASGTVISNSATVSYQVGGISQPDVNSGPATFVVDNKIDLTVATTDTASVKVTPGATAQVLTFTVTNTGNATQDFILSATAVSGGAGAFGGTDNFDATSVSIFVDNTSNGTVGTYDPGIDTATSINDLAADGSITVFIVADIPLGRATGDVASYHLVAEARDATTGNALTETAGADTAGSVDIVFADGQGSDTTNDAARDAKHSSQDDYEILTAALTVTKSSAVISDPFNGTTNPKRIPGAVVEYTIQIDNAAGGTTATNVIISDDLSTEVSNGTITFNADSYGGGRGIQVTAPNINGGAATALTNAPDADQGDYGDTAANTVTVTGITLNAGESATVRFQVTVQ